MIRTLGLATVILVGCLRAVAAPVCSPSLLVWIVVEDHGPNAKNLPYASLPRTIYRYQSTFARVEQPLAAEDTKGISIYNEPDGWFYRSNSRKGWHDLDTKPPLIVRVQLFADHLHDRTFPKELLELEFACESEFFDRRNITGDRRAFSVGEWKVVLVLGKKTHMPAFAFLFHAGQMVTALNYIRYETLRTNMNLFQRPPGVSFTEEPQR
jgi:hypothetical protein